MSKTTLVLKNEFLTVIRRKSFLVTLFLLPLLGILSLLIINLIQKSTGQNAGSVISNLFQPPVVSSREGFVDESGLVKTIPKGVEGQLARFDTEVNARAALTAGEISAYYIISQDYLESGEVIYVKPNFNPLGGTNQGGSIDILMASALTGGDVNLASRVQNPLNIKEVSLSNETQRDTSNPLTFIIPYLITFLFYIVILTSSSLMLSSITDEKQNRVMEILMTSITPSEMLTGKIIALGIAGLIQTLVWLGSGILMLNFSGQTFALAEAFRLPTSLLLWGILFFIFGYTIYASLMAGVGALVPNLREASQATTVIIMPLIIPLVFISSLIQAPNGTLSVFLSLFPFTSPVSMMARLASVQVPLWQILVSLALLILTAVLLIRAVARLFRAQNLLSGNAFSTKTFFKRLFSQA